LSSTSRKSNVALQLAGVFLVLGILLLALSMFLEMQVAAFIGLSLTFWGAVLALTRRSKFVESELLDSTARSAYSTIDRMITDLNYGAQGFYIPAYPGDVALPNYLTNLREPAVYISSSFDVPPSIDELASGKFISSQTRGFFISSPGSGILSQVEKQLNLDLSKVTTAELCEVLPKSLTEYLNLARKADMSLESNGANFKAVGIIYDSFYVAGSKFKSVNMLGCPVVSAVASALAKSSGKTVVVKEQELLPENSVNVTFSFV